MSDQINVLLVHGAWADGSCWSKVIPLLQAKGLRVTAAQIPLTSLEDDVAVTRRLLSTISGPTILVGHSYGGAVITAAGVDAPNVKGLVYITAFGLDEGESLASLSEQGPPRRALPRSNRMPMASCGSTAPASMTPSPRMRPMRRLRSWRSCRSR